MSQRSDFFVEYFRCRNTNPHVKSSITQNEGTNSTNAEAIFLCLWHLRIFLLAYVVGNWKRN